MRAAWLLLGLCIPMLVRAADSSGALHIRAGRVALEAGNPAVAHAEFEAAIRAPLADEDRIAAWLGLGRAELWLGHYRPALNALEKARLFALNAEDRRAVETSTARALNALEYHQQAYALMTPYAQSDPAAAVELARAATALGRSDQALRLISECPAPDPSTRTGLDLLRVASQVDFELAPRAEGAYSYAHDSDDMTIGSYGLTALLPGAPGGATFNTWRLTAATSNVVGSGQTDHLTEADVGDHVGIGDSQHFDMQAGMGSAAGRNFLEGSLQWEDRLSDTASVFASANRLPIVTPTALINGLLYSTFNLGASLRPADQWMLAPVYLHQTFSGGNQRDGGGLKVVLSPFEIPKSTSALGAEIEARAYRSTQPSAGRYFNPARYRQAQLSLIGIHQFNPDWRIRFTAGIGPETVDDSGGRTWSWALSLIGRLPGNGRLELHAGRDSFASLAGGGSGYWSNGGSFTVGWPL